MCYLNGREYWISNPFPPNSGAIQVFWNDRLVKVYQNKGEGSVQVSHEFQYDPIPLFPAYERGASPSSALSSTSHESRVTSHESPCPGTVASSCFSPG